MMNSSANAVAAKIEQLKTGFSWSGLAQVETSIDSMQEKLTQLNQRWVEYLTCILDLGEMQQASAVGRAQLKQVAERIGKLRTDLSAVKMPQDVIVQQPPQHSSQSAPQPVPARPLVVKPKVKLESVKIPKF